MLNQVPVIDYRNLRFSNINTSTFRHLKLLLFWPIFGLAFLYVERFYPVTAYHPVACALDDRIPFCEFFLVPYLFWFLFIIGMHLYLLLYDIEGFRKMMYFFILSFTTTMIIYFLYPTCQELRPAAFERDNLFTRFLTHFYQFDTNTNVCPSMHVIGSVAVACAAMHTPHFSSVKWKWTFWLTALLISISTVMLKQHSILDVVLAIPLCVAAYLLIYHGNILRKKQAWN